MVNRFVVLVVSDCNDGTWIYICDLTLKNLFCASLSLSITNIVAGLTLVVLIVISRFPHQQPSGNFENKSLLLAHSGNYITHLEHHSNVMGRQGRVGKGLGFSFYWGVGWGSRISRAHSLLMKLKQNSKNLKHRKRKKKQAAQMIYKTKESGVGWGKPGFLSRLVAGTVIYLK